MFAPPPRGPGGGRGRLDELEALGLVVGQARLEEHRVHPELGVEQRHVAVHLDEEVDALVALVEVRVVVRQRLRTAGAAEGPARRHLSRRDGTVRSDDDAWRVIGYELRLQINIVFTLGYARLVTFLFSFCASILSNLIYN